jgi:hypothetical protein
MNNDLAPPSPDLARKLLTTVPYRDRLTACRLMEPVGVLQDSIRSLREAYLHLLPDARTLPAVNLPSLAAWVEKVLGDVELAEELQRISCEGKSYVEACVRSCEQIEARLVQAQAVAGG